MVDFYWALYCVPGTISSFNHDNKKGPFLITAMFCNKQRLVEVKLFAPGHPSSLAAEPSHWATISYCLPRGTGGSWEGVRARDWMNGPGNCVQNLEGRRGRGGALRIHLEVGLKAERRRWEVIKENQEENGKDDFRSDFKRSCMIYMKNIILSYRGSLGVSFGVRLEYFIHKYLSD